MKRNIKEKAIHYSKIIATEKNFTLFIILTLVLIPLGEIATLVHNEYFVSQPVIVDFAGWVGSIMAVAYFIANRKKYYPSDFFLFTLFMFAVISSATFARKRFVPIPTVAQMPPVSRYTASVSIFAISRSFLSYNLR